MSTTAPIQLDPASLDTSGISVATTVASDPNPRTGTVYDPVTFAAGAPIWFHPMPGGGHLMVCARTWHEATPSGGGGLFTDYSESLLPSWFVVQGLTGKRDFVPGWGRWVPMNTITGGSQQLKAAASRAPDYLYLLHSADIAGQPGALVQLIRVAPRGTTIYLEEVAPSLTVARTSVNHVIDPTFEDTTIHRNEWWTPDVGNGYSTEHARSGTHSIKLIESAAGWDGFSLLPVAKSPSTTSAEVAAASVRVTPGQRYYSEIWVYPTTSVGSVDFAAAFRDSTEANETIWITWGFTDYRVLPTPAANTWTKLSGYLTVPAGYDRMEPYFEVADDAVGLTVYVDDPVVQGPGTIVFDKGMQYATPYLNLYGTDPNGQIYQIRKKWGEIGSTRQESSGYTPGWEYFTGLGFSTDPLSAAPLAGVTSAGPLSFAAFRYVTLMSTVSALGTGYIGQVYESRQGRPFRPSGPPIALGSDPTESYLGHGLALQPQLETNPAMLPAADSGGIPYVVTTKTSVTTGPPADRGSALINTWGLHTIRL
jgi:hypothetical protein